MTRQHRLWMQGAGRFFAPMVPMLAERGIHVSYICAAPRILDRFRGAPACTFHSVVDAMAGRDPAGKAVALPTPDPELLVRLRDCELVTMQMLERLNYFNFPPRELRSVYLRYVSYWYETLQTDKPDAVLFVALPHMAFNYVLYHLCRVLGVRTLITERTSISDRLLLLEDIDERPGHGLERQAPLPEECVDTDPPERNYYKRRARTFPTPEPGNGLLGLALALARHTLRVGRDVARRASRLHRPHDDSVYALWYAGHGRLPRLATHLWHQLRDGLAMQYTRWSYGRLAVVPELSRDYVYFPLHMQPERAVMPMAADYPDQLSALRLVAESLPPGWLLYVKEHPRQFWDPLRFRIARGGTDFYRAVCAASDRVRLVSSSVSNDTLVEHARCVATLAGTAGWEAVSVGVPAVIFGRPWYLHAPGVRQVTSRRSCEEALHDVASGRLRVIPDEVARYRQWITEHGSFQGYFEDVYERYSPLTPEANARLHADAIAARLALTHGSSRQALGVR